MIRELLAWIAFYAILLGAVWLAVWFDQKVLKPALDRRTARVLGITVDEYQQMQREMWRRLRVRALRAISLGRFGGAKR